MRSFGSGERQRRGFQPTAGCPVIEKGSQCAAFAALGAGHYARAVEECGDLLDGNVVEIDVATVSKKGSQYVRGTVEPHAGATFALDVEVNRLGPGLK